MAYPLVIETASDFYTCCTGWPCNDGYQQNFNFCTGVDWFIYTIIRMMIRSGKRVRKPGQLSPHLFGSPTRVHWLFTDPSLDLPGLNFGIQVAVIQFACPAGVANGNASSLLRVEEGLKTASDRVATPARMSDRG